MSSQVSRPEHPAHPAAASGLSLGSQPPTFSWALLNFFCTCLAKRPAAPPARPSAILPTPPGAACPGPAPCGFLEAPRGGSAFPSCLASGQAGLAQVTPPRCRLGITLDRLRPRAPGRTQLETCVTQAQGGGIARARPAGRSPALSLEAHGCSARYMAQGVGEGPSDTCGAQACWVCSQEAGDAGLPSGGASSRPALNPLPLK